MTTFDKYAIQVKNVSKMYKKYRSNLYKILDLFGLCGKNGYDEFWPLKDISLNIKKGEKVGLIGENGAGKTTLLSIISGNLKQNTGSVKVDGIVKALFVLGVGFHPEFSGRENIRSALSFQGINAKDLNTLEDEIIDFSELGDFIDQPIKTYSAGMYARLAFTVATSIKPEILIIDEILGAGDAYFNSKALERMKSLTKMGTTVLFVSHDLSAIQKNCDRCIWIDKGIIREDGLTLDVIKAYSADVRKREELRLLTQNTGIKAKSTNGLKQILFRFITEKLLAPNENGFLVHKISLFLKEYLIYEIRLGSSMDNSSEQDGFIITNDKMNWTDGLKKNGKWCREFKEIGGKYIHAAGIFNIASSLKMEDLKFEVEYFDHFDDIINFDIFNSVSKTYNTIASFSSKNTNQWLVVSFGGDKAIDSNKLEKSEPDTIEKESNETYGSSEAVIENFIFLNRDFKEHFVFNINDKIIFRIYYRAFKKIEKPVFVIAIYTLDGITMSQLIDKEKKYTIDEINGSGYVDFVVENLKIGRGEYIVSVAIFQSMDLNDPVEPIAYCVHDRKYRFKIEQQDGICMDLGRVYQDFHINYVCY